MYPDICNNLDLFQLYLDFLDIKSICQLLSVSKQFTDIMNQSKRTFQPIIPLKRLPSNSKLFENICYFKVQYTGIGPHVPAKENETHLIEYYNNYSKGITDVIPFGNVHTLDLSYCKKITDVSALGKVHTLNLRGCTGITDVSALGKVHTLDLRGCTGITHENIQLLRERNPTIVIKGR